MAPRKPPMLIPLGTLCSKIGSGVTPRGGDSVYLDEGVSLIRSQNVYNFEFMSDGLAYIDEKQAEKMEGVTVLENDVLLNITGDSVARCCMVPTSVLPARVNQHVSIIRTHATKLNPRFLMYYLTSPYAQAYLLSLAGSGGTRKALTKAMIEALKLPVPELEVQNQISSILSNYDDLIENNRRRIELLEQSARMLYKEWFVSLRFPGHEHVEVKDGAPKGWEKKLIGDVCQTIGGGTPSTQKREYWEDGDITWVTPTDVTRNDCLALLDSEKKITEAGLRESSAKLVPPNTILMTSRASIGFFAMMDKEASTNQGFISIIPNEPSLRMYMLHNLINRVEEIRSNAGGTTFKEITKSRFRVMSILVPPKPLLEQFEESAYLILEQTRLLKKQIKRLQQARDLLLPRLMNGEIVV